MRTLIAALLVASALIALACAAPTLRRTFVRAVITWDTPPSTPAPLPGATGRGLAPSPRVRVVLVDGLSADATAGMPTWSALCRRGMTLSVDVGFPTVSLPVQVSLWTGLTQQQTGVVFRSDLPLVPPLDRRGLPARIPDSHAVAENHGYIARSLGFSRVEPEAGERASKDRDPAAWEQQWLQQALAAVRGPTRLAFVHVLGVDVRGHREGRTSAGYARAVAEADHVVAQLVAADPDARWFLLSDHGHLPGGGHGGEERAIRQVQHCIVGPGIQPAAGGPVHLVDVSRALADSLGLALDRRSPGRPIDGALASPLVADQALPPLATGRTALALALLALGLVVTVAAIGWRTPRRWWLAPWWFLVAVALLLAVRGLPTMSTPMVYAREDLLDLFDLDRRLMMRSWIAALPIAAVATWFGVERASLWRVVAGQLALPVLALAAALAACGGWAVLLGAEVSPTVPRYTALASPLFLIASQGAAAVALAALSRLARQGFGRSRAAGTSRSAP